MCAKILEASGKLNVDEYNFFLRGGIVSINIVIHPGGDGRGVGGSDPC